MPAEKFKAGSPAPLPLLPRNEKEVMISWQLNEDAPLVSICCATYNHADFLEDALNGFLGQITTFPFEIIIRDDASTDGTTNIVLAYASRFPHIIRPIIEKENQHSKGIRANPALVPFAKGEFIALCEGDDYWISPDKLEKQVGLMRTYPQATMSVAQSVVCNKEKNNFVCATIIIGNNKELQYFDEIKETYFHTSTYLIRTAVYRNVLDKYLNKIEYGDTSLRYMLVDVGPLIFLKEVVSVYRLTPNGIWTSLDKRKKIAWEIKAFEDFYKHFTPAYRSHFGKKLLYLYTQMLRHNVWFFNNRHPAENFMRFCYFLIIYGASFLWERMMKRSKCN